MLGAILSWEGQDPDLAAEHFLTVASYNLQHPAQFMEDVLEGLRIAVVDYLYYGVSPAELRRRAGRTYEGKRRVLKPENERRPVLHRWEMTIADVYLSDHPEGAADRVRTWGKSLAGSFHREL
jgi:hypothetical protein